MTILFVLDRNPATIFCKRPILQKKNKTPAKEHTFFKMKDIMVPF